MLFLLTAFALESKCKNTKKFQIHKIIFIILKKRCIFAVEKYVNLYRKIE